MPRLTNGREKCDKCHKPYIPNLSEEGCKCIIEKPEPAKTLTTGELTVEVFKYRKRAREAERVNKVLIGAMQVIHRIAGTIEGKGTKQASEIWTVISEALKQSEVKP